MSASPARRAPQAGARRGWGRRFHPPAAAAHPKIKPRVRARVPTILRACVRRDCPSTNPTCEVRAVAGGASEGDLQRGGGPVHRPHRRGGEAVVHAESRALRSDSARTPVQLPLAPAHSPAALGRPLPPACEPCSRALSAGAAAGNSSVLMTMAGAGVRLA